MKRLLPLGRVSGHRGRGGELTVKVFRGEADSWTGLREVWIGDAELEEGSSYEVEHSRAYKDRLVLKLGGLEDSTAAEALRGRRVAAPVDQAPALPPGRYYAALLVGLEVRDPDDRRIGRVVDVMPTGGSDLLVIDTAEAAKGGDQAEDAKHSEDTEDTEDTEDDEEAEAAEAVVQRDTKDDRRVNRRVKRRVERTAERNQARQARQARQERQERDEVLVPLVDAIVEEVDEVRGVIRIRPPEGLLELNRGD